MARYKASAVANPIQGLVKYHGKIDEYLRLPSHNSISVNVGGMYTHTTVEISDTLENNEAIIDGEKTSGEALDRILRVFNKFKELANLDDEYKIRVVSKNNFPSRVGLGSSASGFAALAYAITKALKLDLDLRDISKIARIGSGSASRSVVGGFSEWVMATTHEESYAYRLAGDEIPLRMVIAVIPKVKDMPTTLAQVETEKSPFYTARLGYIPIMLRKMRDAILSHDVEEIGRLAEIDTLNLHAVIMTGPSGIVMWRPETIEVIRRVRRMRREGIPAYFSIDTGATVFVNVHEKYAEEVAERLSGIQGTEIHVEGVGLEAKEVDNHLF